MRSAHGCDGIDGSVLDPALSNPGDTRFPGIPRECAACEECAWTKERCVRLLVDSVPAFGGLVKSKLSTARRDLCHSVALEASREPRADGSRAYDAYAKGAQRDESTASPDRKSTRLNSSHRCISYAVFC